MSKARQDSVRLLNALAAVALSLVIFVCGLAAVAGDLHQGLHGGTECGDSQCVIALFGAGAVSVVTGDIPVPPPGCGDLPARLLAPAVCLSSSNGGLAGARDPPMCHLPLV